MTYRSCEETQRVVETMYGEAMDMNECLNAKIHLTINVEESVTLCHELVLCRCGRGMVDSLRFVYLKA